MTTRVLNGSLPSYSPPDDDSHLGWFWRALDWIGAAHERARQRAVLAGLDDRMLRDIGLSRTQALAEARRPFWE